MRSRPTRTPPGWLAPSPRRRVPGAWWSCLRRRTRGRTATPSGSRGPSRRLPRDRPRGGGGGRVLRLRDGPARGPVRRPARRTLPRPGPRASGGGWGEGRRPPALAAAAPPLRPHRRVGGDRPGAPGRRRPVRGGRTARRRVPAAAVPGGAGGVEQRSADAPGGGAPGSLAAGDGPRPGVQQRRPGPAGRRPALRGAGRAGAAAPQPRRHAAPDARPGAGRADGSPDGVLPDQVVEPACRLRSILERQPFAGSTRGSRGGQVDLAVVTVT